MAIKNTRLGGTNWTSEALIDTDINDTFDAAEIRGPPIGGIIAWHKTFVSIDSGTTTATTANKLVQSGQNFLTTVSIGQIVFNSTDSTWAYVTAVDSDTTLSLSSDIMANAEAYTIYATPYLPSAWVECNGQVLSDADSPFNGGTIPSLNGTTDATRLFIRGLKNAVTGTTGGAATVTLTDANLPSTTRTESGGYRSTATWTSGSSSTVGHMNTSSSAGTDTPFNIMPPYVNLTWIMRIK
jgi:microcystin-dependent protein